MGALGCGSTLIKYLLFFFNFLCAIGGLALAALGGMSIYSLRDVDNGSGSIHTYSTVLLAVGLIMFVVAFYGCCGAVRESHCMLITFAILLLTLIVLELAIAATIFGKKDDILQYIDQGVRRVFDRADSGEPAAIISKDGLQRGFRCCGRDFPVQLGILPDSCCSSPPCNTFNAYHKGCVPAVRDFFETHSQTLAYVAIGVAVIELLEVFFAFGLATSIRRADARRY